MMKFLALALLALIATTQPLLSQAPPPSGKPKSPVSEKLTAHDIRVFPFAQEHDDVKFKSREFPSELTVVVGDKIHFYGKRRSDGAPTVRGKPTGHIGQVALLPPGERKGTLALKKSFGSTLFFAVFELPDDTLKSHQMQLKEGKTYTWTAKTENGTTTLRVLGPDGSEVASEHVPSDKVLGLGFAGTVRNQGNEIDMTITYE